MGRKRRNINRQRQKGQEEERRGEEREEETREDRACTVQLFASHLHLLASKCLHAWVVKDLVLFLMATQKLFGKGQDDAMDELSSQTKARIWPYSLLPGGLWASVLPCRSLSPVCGRVTTVPSQGHCHHATWQHAQGSVWALDPRKGRREDWALGEGRRQKGGWGDVRPGGAQGGTQLPFCMWPQPECVATLRTWDVGLSWPGNIIYRKQPGN